MSIFRKKILIAYRNQRLIDNGKRGVNGKRVKANGTTKGDTIVEVMVSITVLGLALGAAYGLSNRSFNTAVHTHDRIEALSLAQGQVEFLKDRGLKGTINSLITQYGSAGFCFNDTNNSTMNASACRAYRGSIYDLAISYCSGGACGQPNVFTVKASWIATGRGQQNQLTIFYKPPS